MTDPESPILQALRSHRQKDPALVDAALHALQDHEILIHVGPDDATDPMVQHVAAAAVNLAARIFPRIRVSAPDVPVMGVPLVAQGPSLAEGLVRLAADISPNGSCQRSNSEGAKLAICLGARRCSAAFTIRTDANGWLVFISTDGRDSPWQQRLRHPATPLAAAACAVAEATKHALHGLIPSSGTDEPPSYVLNLLNLTHGSDSVNVALPDTLDVGDLHVVGLGSLGSTLIYCLCSHPSIAGRLVLLDHDELEPRNMLRYALMRAGDASFGKVAWAEQHLRNTHPHLNILGQPTKIQDWARTLPRGYRVPLAVIVPDNLDARREAADLLPRSAITATAEGAVATVNHCHFASTWCPFCAYVPDGEGEHTQQQWSRLTGLTPQRINELNLPNENPNGKMALLSPADLRIIENHVRVAQGSLQKWVGRTLVDFLRAEQHTLYSATPVTRTGGDSAPLISLALPFVSAFAGALVASELIKELVPTLHETYGSTYATYEHNVLRRSRGTRYPARRDALAICLCRNITRQRWYLEMWPEDAHLVSQWSTLAVRDARLKEEPT